MFIDELEWKWQLAIGSITTLPVIWIEMYYPSTCIQSIVGFAVDILDHINQYYKLSGDYDR